MSFAVVLQSANAQIVERSRPADLVEFRLFYPLVGLREGASYTQRNYAGVDMNYSFMFSTNFALTLNVFGWFLPIKRASLNQNAIVFAVGLGPGLAYRPFPNSYFDPVVSGLAPLAMARGGSNLAPKQFIFPVLGRFSFNIYKQREVFSETDLALAFVSSAGHVFKQIDVLRPTYFDVGLALRGSF